MKKIIKFFKNLYRNDKDYYKSFKNLSKKERMKDFVEWTLATIIIGVIVSWIWILIKK